MTIVIALTLFVRVRMRTEALKECGRTGEEKRLRGGLGGGREGQSLWNWLCFLYVSDVLRLPGPSLSPTAAVKTQRVKGRVEHYSAIHHIN